MGALVSFDTRKVIEQKQTIPHNDSVFDGGDGGGSDMLERVKKLEEQIISVATDVAIIKSNYATKADLHEEIGKQTKWIAVTIIGTVSIAMAVAKLIF